MKYPARGVFSVLPLAISLFAAAGMSGCSDGATSSEGPSSLPQITRERAEALARSALREFVREEFVRDIDLDQYTVETNETGSEWTVRFDHPMPRRPGSGFGVFVSKKSGKTQVFQNE